MTDVPQSRAWNSTPKSRGRSNVSPSQTMTRCQTCGAFPSWQRDNVDPRRLCERHWDEVRAAEESALRP